MDDQDIGLFIHPNTSFKNLHDYYKQCAEMTFDKIISDRRKIRDSNKLLKGLLSMEHSGLVFPLFFNYRQAIELSIKDCLSLTDQSYNRSHNLADTFQTLLSACEKECDPAIYQSLKDTAGKIEHINDIDPKGTKFRYDDHDQQYEPICILRLRAYCHDIMNILDKAHSNLCAVKDFKSDRF